MTKVRLSALPVCLAVTLAGWVAFSLGCARVSSHGSVPLSALPASTLVVADRVDHLDVLAREPMVVEHPDGTLFVSGYGQPGPKLWKSQDRGATWARVNVGSEADGAIGNSDVDLAVAGDGTLYFVTMGYDRKANEGTHIAIGVSRSLGATWRWTMLSKDRFDDRPWVAVAADGTAHVIWNDGSGVRHAVSRDGGVNWTEQPRIHGQGGSSHLAVGPNREVAVRVTPLSASGFKFNEGVDLIAVSADGGLTWQNHPAPGQKPWSASFSSFPPRWVEPLAWDAQGNLYSFWADGKALWLAQSLDRGATWASWQVAEGDEDSYFPYLIARGRGELAATWFSGRGETLQAHAARFDVGSRSTPPKIIESPPFRPDTWGRDTKPEDPPIRDTGGEYLAVTFLKAGGVAVVSPIQDEREHRFGFTWWRLEER
ncbi:MAG TPA: sialidase family protein [Bryobacteraceae bacterium]|nr:sialidase family protein [Bryobacteraceae bacterium]